LLTLDPPLGLAALVIAHDDLVGALLGIMIELEGYRATFAKPGESCLAALERVHPDLALVDYEFACASRGQLADWARATHTSAVVFSPSRDHADIELLADAYGLAWFAPPFERESFARAVNEARRRA
jgi:CheY-like chemotaxis protein